MPYVKTQWVTDDVITANKLNNIEGGIEGLDSQVTQIDSQVSQISLQVTEIDSQVSEIVPQVTQLGNQVSQLDSQVIQLGNQVSTVPEHHEILNNYIELPDISWRHVYGEDLPIPFGAGSKLTVNFPGGMTANILYSLTLYNLALGRTNYPALRYGTAGYVRFYYNADQYVNLHTNWDQDWELSFTNDYMRWDHNTRTITMLQGTIVNYDMVTFIDSWGEEHTPALDTWDGDDQNKLSIDIISQEARAVSVVPAPLQSVQITILSTDWIGMTATKEVDGITATNIVWVSPAPASYVNYATAEIRATIQSANSLTFECSETPTLDITVNILIGEN